MASLNATWYCVWEHDTIGYGFYRLRNVLPIHEHRLCDQNGNTVAYCRLAPPPWEAGLAVRKQESGSGLTLVSPGYTGEMAISLGSVFFSHKIEVTPSTPAS